jgi:DNA-binding beta-propeller fold protein YncE
MMTVIMSFSVAAGRFVQTQRTLFTYIVIGLLSMIAFAASVDKPGGRSQWPAPKSGWLYVLDYDAPSQAGRLLLVSPAEGKVEGALNLGNIPELAMSSSGQQLYVASVRDAGDSLSTIDTHTGAFINSVEIKDRWQYTSSPEGPVVSVSENGRWLYLLKMQSLAKDQDEYSVALYDAVKGTFLPREVSTLGCSGILLPLHDNERVTVLCEGGGDVHFLKRTIDGLEEAAPQLRLDRAPETANSVGTGTVLINGDVLIVTNDGQLAEIDSNSCTIIHEVHVAGLANEWTPARLAELSPDGSKVYFGIGPAVSRSSGKANEVAVLDVSSLRLIARIKTRGSFWSLTMSPDGQTLYAIDPDTRSIFVIDTVTKKQVRVIGPLGVGPVLAFVAP